MKSEGMTDSDELYSFGSNKYGALGCEPEMAPKLGYTPMALPIRCFNTMINRIGRGVIRDFDVGAYMTVVCTFPYNGPTEEQLLAMEEEAEMRAEEEAVERERLERVISKRKLIHSESNEPPKKRMRIDKTGSSIHISNCSLSGTKLTIDSRGRIFIEWKE